MYLDLRGCSINTWGEKINGCLDSCQHPVLSPESAGGDIGGDGGFARDLVSYGESYDTTPPLGLQAAATTLAAPYRCFSISN